MKNKIIALTLIAVVLMLCFGVSASADMPAERKILHSFYSNGVFNARHQHLHVLSYYEYANSEKSDSDHSGSAFKFTGDLYLQEKTAAKAFSAISEEIDRAIDAGAAYLTFWAYINETNISADEEYYAPFDLYLPSNPRTRGEWVFVTQKITNKNQNQLYFKSKGVYTWLDDINIMIIPPDDPSMSIENVCFRKKDGTAADSQSVYYKSVTEIYFNNFVDNASELAEIKVLKMSDETETETKVSVDANKIIITPLKGYEKNTEYKILLKNIKNIFGRELESAEILFKTAKADKRVENEIVKSSGNTIENGDSICSLNLECDIINDSESDADLRVIFAAEKNGETIKATAKECVVNIGSSLIGLNMNISKLKTYIHNEDYSYKTYLLDNSMLPAEYEKNAADDKMTAAARLSGDILEFRASFDSGEKRAVTFLMVKSENNAPNFGDIGYFKTGFTDERGEIKLAANVSASVETGSWFLLVYGEGAEPYSLEVHYTGEDVRNDIAATIMRGSGDEIAAMLGDVKKGTDLRAVGVMLDEYALLSEQASYICNQTANDTPTSEKYGDCVNLLNRYIVLAKLKQAENFMFSKVLAENSELLMLEKRTADVFAEASKSGNYNSFSNINGIKDYNTFAEFKGAINSIAAITALNLIEGNDYPSVLKALNEFKDVIGIDAEKSFDSYNISEYNKTLILKELIGADFVDVKPIKDAFLAAIEKYKPQANRPSGGGGGGGGRGGASVRETIASSGDINKIIENLENKNIMPQFSDLKGYEWAAPAIGKLSKAGMISGYPDGCFKPADPITRAEFVKIIISGIFADSETAECGFLDVEKDDWSYSYIAKALNLEIIKGISETHFGTNEYITREQMAVICKRIADKTGLKTEKAAVREFADIDEISEYAKDAVESLQMGGIINGDENGCFNPKISLSRAEAAMAVCGIYNLMEEQEYDKNQN